GAVAGIRAAGGLPDRQQIIDRGKIVSADAVTRSIRAVATRVCKGEFRTHRRNFAARQLHLERAKLAHHRLRTEAIQPVHASDDGSKRRGNLRIARIGKMILPVYAIAVNFGVKSFLNFAGRAGKIDHVAAVGDAVYLEAVRAEPRGDG